MEEKLAKKVIILPNATLHRLYRLAQRLEVSPDRVITHLIDQASRDLSIAEWEQAQAASEHSEGIVYGMECFKRRL